TNLATDPQRYCAPSREFRLGRLPPTLNSWGASCHVPDMIAPTGRGCKRPQRPNSPATCGSLAPRKGRHGNVSGIIIPPHFRQATALWGWDKQILRWPGPFSSGFLSPQPPGAVGIGPVRRIVYPHTGPTKVGPFSFGGCRFLGRHSGARAARTRNLVSAIPGFRVHAKTRVLRCAIAHRE
ncbi:MAG: hypothetical protein JWR80_4207, partial [Bradyrhizobium sp.]|nr:hypothetical protein [Bradyrhizobium sp.]